MRILLLMRTCAALAALTLGACIPNPAPTPTAVPSLSWPTVLGSVRRDGFAAAPAPDSAVIDWSIGAGKGLLASPLVAPPLIITGTSNRMVVANSTVTGNPNWERHIDGAVGKAVVAMAGRVFAVSEERDGAAYGLEPLHGRIAWKEKIGYAAAAPLIVGDTLVVPLEAERVVALRTRDGHLAWSTRLPAPPATTPVPFGDILAIGARNDSIYVLRRSDGAITGRGALGGYASSTVPALTGDTLLVPVETGGLVALRLPSLERLFTVRGSTGTPAVPVLAAPVVAPDGSVYFLESGGDVWRLPPHATTAQRLASLGSGARASLTLARNGLVVGLLDGTLARVNFDGAVAWSIKLDGSICAPAAIADGALYVPLQRGRIVKVR
jgi:outer membrane protein assembly factor BamB